MPRLLALDLAMNGTGWALLDGKGPPRLGTIYPARAGDISLSAAMFDQWLEDHYVRYPWDAMAWEKPLLMRTDTPDKIIGAYGLAFLAAAFAGHRRMRWMTVTVDEVKYAVCGDLWKEVDGRRMKMDKNDMVHHANVDFDWGVSTHHEADAAGVGLVAFSTLWPNEE